jgi:hypothetical protein
MSSLLLQEDVFLLGPALLGLSVAGGLAGLVGLLWPRVSLRRPVFCAQVVFLLVLAGLWAADAVIWVPSVFAGTVGVILQICLVMGIPVTLQTVCARPVPGRAVRLPVGLLMLGVGLTGWLTWRLTDVSPSTLNNAEDPAGMTRVGESARPLQAFTDAGRPIRIFAYTGEARPPQVTVTPRKIGSPLDRPVPPRMIQVGRPDLHYNCHGWTFTGGQYLLDSRSVEQLLQDNGYQKVAKPEVGDLIIYRDEETITHSGVVKALGNDGFVLIESKWGLQSRYLHEPDVSNYGSAYEYYRSPRPGHLLMGLPDSSPPAAPSFKPVPDQNEARPATSF